MADVDPFIQPIPTSFNSDRELRAYFEYLHRFLHDLWVRTGGTTDSIEESQLEDNGVILALANSRRIADIDNQEALQCARPETIINNEALQTARNISNIEEQLIQIIGMISRLEKRVTNIENEL